MPAYITSIAYDEDNFIFCVSSSDKNIYIYKKTISMELTNIDAQAGSYQQSKARMPEF